MQLLIEYAAKHMCGQTQITYTGNKLPQISSSMTETTTAKEARKKVDLLNYLYVNKQSDEQHDLLVIKAGGISTNENIGIPKLVPTQSPVDVLTNGILEFNFIIQSDKIGSKNKLTWDISVVYQMDNLPKGIKAIKVNAAHNADIALLLN